MDIRTQSKDCRRILPLAVLHFKNQHCLQDCNLSRIFNIHVKRTVDVITVCTCFNKDLPTVLMSWVTRVKLHQLSVT